LIHDEELATSRFSIDADHGEVDEGADGSGVALEIPCQAPETAEPGKGAFDDPALG
jgi:hypothetical protein